MKPLKLKEILSKELSKKEMEFAPSSFDIVGEIAIVDIKEELKGKENIVGKAIVDMHKNVSTACTRIGEHSGVFRTQKLKVIAGKRRKEAIHKESGCMLKLNVEKCYFSARSGTERLRVAGMVNDEEDVLVMFSGVGPFVCIIGKNSKCKSITGVELNPIAHKYAVENLKLNKIKNGKVIEGDVRVVVPKLGRSYDRIVMPLPRTAEEFLDTALIVAKKGTMIHLYGFLGEDEFDDYKKKIKDICKEQGFKVKIKDLVKCGQFSPRVFRICVDFEVM